MAAIVQGFSFDSTLHFSLGWTERPDDVDEAANLAVVEGVAKARHPRRLAVDDGGLELVVAVRTLKARVVKVAWWRCAVGGCRPPHPILAVTTPTHGLEELL
jgi:hypothetical protein